MDDYPCLVLGNQVYRKTAVIRLVLVNKGVMVVLSGDGPCHVTFGSEEEAAAAFAEAKADLGCRPEPAPA